MRYLVTGASGFAGGYVLRQLAGSGHDVVGMVRRGGTLRKAGFTEVIADLRNAPAVNMAVEAIKPDAIFHLAAPETSVGHSWQEPENTIEINLSTTLNLLGAARRLEAPPKIMFVSSSEVLGTVNEKDLPTSEDQPVHPESPYAVSKAQDEEVCTFYAEHYRVPVVIVRSFNYIGPGQRPQFVMPRFATEIAKLERQGGGELKVGNLASRRDFTDVRDMATAYVAALEKGTPGETYHAGSGKDYAIEELLGKMLELSTATIDVVADPAFFRPTDIPVTRCDNRKLKKLGWSPTIPIDQTLRDVLTEARRNS